MSPKSPGSHQKWGRALRATSGGLGWQTSLSNISTQPSATRGSPLTWETEAKVNRGTHLGETETRLGGGGQRKYVALTSPQGDATTPMKHKQGTTKNTQKSKVS